MSELPKPRSARDAIGIVDGYEIPVPYDPWKRDLKWHIITISSMVVVVVVAFISVLVF